MIAPLARALKSAIAVAFGWSLLLGSAAAAEPAPGGDAKQHFQRGITLVDVGRFEEAAVEFELAYAIGPRPTVLYNIGMAYAAARRGALAVEAFKRYLRSSAGEVDPRRSKEVRAQVERLEAQLAAIELDVTPRSAEVRIDGRVVESVGPVALDPGHHVLEASAQGHATLRRDLTVASGTAAKIVEALPLARPAPAALTGWLLVDCAVPDVEIIVDERIVAKTPRTQPIVVNAGQRRLSFRRPGYRLHESSVVVAEAALVPVDCGLLPTPQRHVAARLVREAQRSRGLERAKLQRFWWTASLAGGGLLLAGATAALIVDNESRYAHWRKTQDELDGEWRATEPNPTLERRQSDNDALARGIRVRDRVEVGVGVAAGGCLLASALVWFVTREPRSTAGATWLFRPSGVDFRAVW
jgi:hypothetical protein